VKAGLSLGFENLSPFTFGRDAGIVGGTNFVRF